MWLHDFITHSEEWIAAAHFAVAYRTVGMPTGDAALSLLTLVSVVGVVAVTVLQSWGIFRHAAATRTSTVSRASVLIEWYWLLQLVVIHLCYTLYVGKPLLLLVVLLLGPGLGYQFYVRFVHAPALRKLTTQLVVATATGALVVVAAVNLVGWHTTWLASLVVVPAIFLVECIEAVRGTDTVTPHRARAFLIAALFWSLYGCASIAVLERYGESLTAADLNLRLDGAWSIIAANVTIGASALASLLFQRTTRTGARHR